MAKKKAAADYGADLRREYDRWNKLRERGGSDPFWTDGCNMNLVRNHILYCKRMIEEKLMEAEYPEEYFLDTPPEVDDNYMANPDLIRKKANEAVRSIKENSDYVFLQREMPNQTKQNAQIFNVVRWVNGYQHAVERDDLVAMRRITPELYADQLREARKKYEETMVQCSGELHLGQLSIFDFISEGSGG